MAEVRVVVQLDEDEYATLLKDVTDVFENESNASERNRKLRMLLQHRGYMTSGYDDNWKVPEGTGASKAKSPNKARQTKKSTR
ncbi:MAG: hypothetical protein ABR606_17675 [Vicinamibacterales bacterium]